MCRDTCCDRRREQPSRTTNQGRRQHALPRRHDHDRTTSWPDSPRGSLTAPLAASGVLPIWPLPLWAFGISRCQSACSSPTAHGSSCTCVAESITHATYNRLESVPGPHSVRQRVYESVSPKVEVATRNVSENKFPWALFRQKTQGAMRNSSAKVTPSKREAWGLSEAERHRRTRLPLPAQTA